MASVPLTVWQFLWCRYEPDDSQKVRTDWESLALAFLRYFPSSAQDHSISAVAGALTSLSESLIERTATPSRKSHPLAEPKPKREVHNGNEKNCSQTSLVDSEDTQQMDVSPPEPSSTPTTPPLETGPNDASILANPEYRTILSQLRALIGPSLTYMFPKSPLAGNKFLVDVHAILPVWYLRPLSEAESKVRKAAIPVFPQELKVELANAIKAQLVRRTTSGMGVQMLRRSGELGEDTRTKTVSSVMHGTGSSYDISEGMPSSPTKRMKAANGAAIPILSSETSHLRILKLESEQEAMRKEIAILKAEIEQLKKSRS